jgi:hypothetical protein
LRARHEVGDIVLVGQLHGIRVVDNSFTSVTGLASKAQRSKQFIRRFCSKLCGINQYDRAKH